MDANPDFTHISSADLEASITGLTANLNAATFQQLMMIAEFDTRQGWGEEGVRSCAHWLNWRCGISLTAAREKLRVAHALQNLPKTRQAFASGELSFSKARAITRVGTVDNEACLLSFARYGTASQLDRTVRLYRRQYEGADALMAGYHRRVLDEPTDPEDPVDPAEAERQGALHHHCHRKLDTRWDEHGCLEIHARLTAEQGAVVLKALEAAAAESPQDAEAPTPAECLKPAACQHRRADALVLMANQSLQHAAADVNSADRYQVVVHVDSQVLSGDLQAKPTGEPDCYIEKQVALPVETARRLSCSCKIVTALTAGSEPLNIGRSSRAISTPIRRALAIRDGQCQFPGCDCDRHLDAHHIVHWASGEGETSLENLIEVCHYHHVQLHEGGFSVQRLEGGMLQFRKPDGSILSNAPEPIHRSDDLPTSAEASWYWCGDTMDYAMATHCIATATHSGQQQG